MAVYFRGLSSRETFALTDAMVRSGEQIHLGRELGRRVVDKHSTGGVGDKTTLAVGPVVAACGVPFGKMSGRGLGHTGGTLDKLESIPGFRVELTTEEFVAQVKEIGIAIVGQTADLVPADKMLYGLRDVTATVDQVSLIAASIMSKKIAAGADAIVLDVKVGDGAFMKTLADAQVLAEAMIALGQHAGRDVICVLTDMDQPLGRAVGQRARGARGDRDGPRRRACPTSRSSCSALLAHLLALSDLGVDLAEGRRLAEQAIADGSALAAYERWVRAQGGDPDEAALPKAPSVQEVFAPRGGLRAAARCAARRTRGAPPRRRPAHEGGRDRPRRRRRLHEEARRRRRGGRSRSRRSTRTTSRARTRPPPTVLAAYELGDEAPRAQPIMLDTVG